MQPRALQPGSILASLRSRARARNNGEGSLAALVQAEINRRITGDPRLAPGAYFARTYCKQPRKRGLILRSPDPALEHELLGLEHALLGFGACEQLVAVDPTRDAAAWEVTGPFDLVIVAGVLSRVPSLEELFDALELLMSADALLYVDEYVGARSESSDTERQIVGRVLAGLSPELAPPPGARFTPGAPSTNGARSTTGAPSTNGAVGSAEIPAILRRRFAPLQERLWGGAILEQIEGALASRVDGNDDLARVLVELDGVLTDQGVLASHYLWGVYRAPVAPRRADDVGRLEAIERAAVLGWAVDPAQPERRLTVDLFVDHKLVGKTVADLPRDDLARSGIGDGAHGFSIELPSWVRDGGQHSLAVLAPAFGHTLPVASGWPVHGCSAEDGTEFTWTEHDLRRPPLPPARVLDGRDGWAFPCDDSVGSIEQMLGRLSLTEPDLECWGAFVAGRAAALAARGIGYALAVAPAKAAVHPDQLLTGSPALGPPRLGRQLLAGLEHAPNVIDLHEPLGAAAAATRQLYFKRDRGFNHEGALIAAEALVAGLRRAGLEVAQLTREIEWIDEPFEGNLAGRPAVTLRDGRLRPSGASSLAEASRRANPDSLRIRWGAPVPIADAAAPAPVVEGPRGPSILVLHDRGGARLLPYLGSVCSRSVWVEGRELSWALIESERPALVLQVLDESELVRVPYS